MRETQDNAAIVRSAYEAFNARQFERGADLYAPNATLSNLATGQTFTGPKGFIEYVSGWATAIPDAQTVLENVVASGDVVMVEFRGVGTHTGPLKTPAGDIQGTGRKIELPFVEVFEMKGGKIAAHRAYFDTGTLMKQIA